MCMHVRVMCVSVLGRGRIKEKKGWLNGEGWSGGSTAVPSEDCCFQYSVTKQQLFISQIV